MTPIVPRLNEPQYPIRAVARMTGLSVDTLRAWERRYDAVVPKRSERGRLYSDADVARLKRLSELVEHGHGIGTIAHLRDVELSRLLTSTDQHTLVAPSPEVVANLQPLTDALDKYDLDAIERTLNGYAVVLPPRELIFAVVLPLLQQVGERWQAGRLRPAQEHLVSAIVRSVLGGLLRASARPSASPKIVLATPTGERHELGLLCTALLAATANYGVVYLGPDLPAADIAHAASSCGAQIVIVSLTHPGVVPRAELRSLANLLAAFELWVGGPAADDLIALTGQRARHLDSIAAVLPFLSHHGR